jgi:hypothetical protein
MDLTKLSDEELNQHRRDVLAEIERRVALETIPEQIAELKTKYLEGGGDPNKLK